MHPLPFHPDKYQVFVPVVEFSALMASAEPVPVDGPEFEDVVYLTRQKIKEVFRRGSTHSSKGMERAWSEM